MHQNKAKMTSATFKFYVPAKVNRSILAIHTRQATWLCV